MSHNIEFPKAPPHPNALASDPGLFKQADERTSFDKVTSQWIFEDSESGTEFQYNFILQRWIPRKSGSAKDEVQGKRGKNEAEIAQEEEENKRNIKKLRKEQMQAVKDEINRLKGEQTKQKTEDQHNESNDNGKRTNTGVYVSNLPSSVTKQDLVAAFSKFGLLSQDFKTGEPRVKLYYDNENNFKNEALVIFHSAESVGLAIEMLNDTYILPPTSDQTQKRIKVERAEFSNNSHSTASAAQDKEKKQLTQEEKKLLSKNKEQLKKKLTDWDDDVGTLNQDSSEPNDKTLLLKRKIWDKVVVAEQMFRAEELAKDPLLEMDIKEDIQEECDKFGIGKDITNIKVYDVSGCVTIKFSKPESAMKCISVFDGRFFDGLKLKVSKFQGQKFESSSRTGDDNEASRITQFGDWLEHNEQPIGERASN